MPIRSRHSLAPILAASLSLGAAASSRAQEPSREELAEQLKALRAQVERLEAAQQKLADEPTKEEIRTTVESVLRDADKRSQPLQAQGFNAGYDKGFFIQSEDKNFVLRPGIQGQFRYVANYNDADSNERDDGFEFRRLRLRFDGNAFTPDLTYLVQWDTNRSVGSLSLLDAWAQYRFAPQWAVKGGQFKESVFHEKDISSFAQLAVDRSLVNEVLGGTDTDRVQGISLIYGGTKENPVRVEFAYHDGANSKNTNFQDAGTDFGVGGRVEYKAFGQWADYKDFTSKNAKQNLLVFGAGTDFTQADAGDFLRTTVDAQFETPDRFGLYAALHLNTVDPDDDIGAASQTDYGALVQASYFVTKPIEVFGRYDIVALDDDAVADGSEDTFNEFTFGANYYFGPDGSYLHKAKFTVDVVYLPDGSPSAETGVGVTAGNEDQFIFRGQFQFIL